jgi:hypothetical protein
VEELQVETRTYRVGGDVTWRDWSFDPDVIGTWVGQNALMIGVALAIVLGAFVLWRLARGRPPEY